MKRSKFNICLNVTLLLISTIKIGSLATTVYSNDSAPIITIYEDRQLQFDEVQSGNGWNDSGAVIVRRVSNASEDYKEIDDNIGVIFLGDSRFVAIDEAVDLSSKENTFVVAKVGEGYQWLTDTALPKITKIVNDNPSYTKWIIISGLGVNDPKNVDSYMKIYETLSHDFSLVLLTVNPLEESKATQTGYNYKSFTNNIKKFNDKIKSSGHTYIDTYSYLMDNGFSTADGVHYQNDTNRDIYDYVINELEEIEWKE